MHRGAASAFCLLPAFFAGSLRGDYNIQLTIRCCNLFRRFNLRNLGVHNGVNISVICFIVASFVVRNCTPISRALDPLRMRPCRKNSTILLFFKRTFYHVLSLWLSWFTKSCSSLKYNVSIYILYRWQKLRHKTNFGCDEESSCWLCITNH